MWEIVYDKCDSTLQLKQITGKKSGERSSNKKKYIKVVVCLKCSVFRITIIQLLSQEIEFLEILLSVYRYWKSLPFSAISLLLSCVGVFMQVNVDLLVIQIYDHLLPCYLLFPVKYNLI